MMTILFYPKKPQDLFSFCLVSLSVEVVHEPYFSNYIDSLSYFT